MPASPTLIWPAQAKPWSFGHGPPGCGFYVGGAPGAGKNSQGRSALCQQGPLTQPRTVKGCKNPGVHIPETWVTGSTLPEAVVMLESGVMLARGSRAVTMESRTKVLRKSGSCASQQASALPSRHCDPACGNPVRQLTVQLLLSCTSLHQLSHLELSLGDISTQDSGGKGVIAGSKDCMNARHTLLLYSLSYVHM